MDDLEFEGYLFGLLVGAVLFLVVIYVTDPQYFLDGVASFWNAFLHYMDEVHSPPLCHSMCL